MYEVIILQGDIASTHYTGDAGRDLFAQISKPIVLSATNRHVLIGTGLRIKMPHQIYAIVQPRSGMSKKQVKCDTGIIDSDYTGEIMVSIYYLGDGEFTINPGDRIAQLIFLPKIQVAFVTGREYVANDFERGSKGFGSTGQ